MNGKSNRHLRECRCPKCRADKASYYWSPKHRKEMAVSHERFQRWLRDNPPRSPLDTTMRLGDTWERIDEHRRYLQDIEKRIEDKRGAIGSPDEEHAWTYNELENLIWRCIERDREMRGIHRERELRNGLRWAARGSAAIVLFVWVVNGLPGVMTSEQLPTYFGFNYGMFIVFAAMGMVMWELLDAVQRARRERRS